jgi:hypothetical protein
MGEWRSVYKVLVGKTEGNTSLGRSRQRWEDHIKMDIKEVGLGGMDWIELAQDRNSLSWLRIGTVCGGSG